ncbi:hypothetical protein PMIN04_008734 [Paraphaeosphaeria minitans]
MLLLHIAFIFAAASSCSSLPSSTTGNIRSADIHDPIAIVDRPTDDPEHERFHARQIPSLASSELFSSPKEDATTPELPNASVNFSAPSSEGSTPLPDIPYEYHSDGSAITLVIIVSIIGGALLLTLAGWAWRKQKDKKSFGPDRHDAELAKHKIMNAGGAPGVAGRHHSRDMGEREARPYQRSPTGPRHVMQQY